MSSLWMKRVKFSEVAKAPLGFGSEYWISTASHYEGWTDLRDRLNSLGRQALKRDIAVELSSNLLEEVVVAAGGVEQAVESLRRCKGVIEQYAREHGVRSQPGVPQGLATVDTVEVAYLFANVMAWSRSVVERVERRPLNRKHFGDQGLLPALKPKRLKKRVETLFDTIRDGPVGETRRLANFTLHTALVRSPHSGIELLPSGEVVLPIPDAPSRPVTHWILLTWHDARDGFAFADELWTSIETFIEGLLDAFEASIPKRLRI